MNSAKKGHIVNWQAHSRGKTRTWPYPWEIFDENGRIILRPQLEANITCFVHEEQNDNTKEYHTKHASLKEDLDLVKTSMWRTILLLHQWSTLAERCNKQWKTVLQLEHLALANISRIQLRMWRITKQTLPGKASTAISLGVVTTPNLMLCRNWIQSQHCIINCLLVSCNGWTNYHESK